MSKKILPGGLLHNNDREQSIDIFNPETSDVEFSNPINETEANFEAEATGLKSFEVEQTVPTQPGAESDRLPPPHTNVSWFSRVMHNWVDEAIIKKAASKGALHETDMHSLPSDLIAEYTAHEASSKQEMSSSIFWWSIRMLGYNIPVVCGISTVHRLCVYSTPYLLKTAIVALESEADIDPYEAIALVCVLFCVPVLGGMAHVWGSNKANDCAIKVSAGALTLVYDKTLRLPQDHAEIGTLVQIVTHDCEILSRGIGLAVQSLCILDFGLVSYLLISSVGPLATFVGFATMVVALVLCSLFINPLQRLSRKRMEAADTRLSKIAEALSSIVVLKYNAWDEIYFDQIKVQRNVERRIMRSMINYDMILYGIIIVLPNLAGLVAIMASDALGYTTSVSDMFGVMLIFDLLRGPLLTLAGLADGMARYRVSIKRLDKFFMEEEILQDLSNVPKTSVMSDDIVMSVNDASFKWLQDNDVATLRNISLEIKLGALVCIVGEIGSGKSSLIAALLGEMRSKASLSLSSQLDEFSKALVTQDPWIQHGSLLSNIVFQHKFDAQRYSDTVDACAMRRDIELLADGDQTELGEFGANLSGGQKQRCAIARAAYANADIYFFDDPLSALDPDVADQVFKNCILGMLGTKTRILATNGLGYLQHADLIIVMDKGEIVVSGPRASVLRDSTTPLANLMIKHGYAWNGAPYSGDEGPGTFGLAKHDASITVPAVQGATSPHQLIKGDERHMGSVDKIHYTLYFHAAGGLKVITLTGILFLLFQASVTGLDAFLVVYTEDQLNLPLPTYFAIGMLLSSLSIIIFVVRGMYYHRNCLEAAIALHEALLECILNAKIEFFHSSASGNLLNRFSRDCNVLDLELRDAFEMFVIICAIMVGHIFPSIFVSPLSIVPLIALTYIFYRLVRHYATAARDFNRMVATAGGPRLSLLTESSRGMGTIRAFAQHRVFQSKFHKAIDDAHRPKYYFAAARRWLDIRLCLVVSAVPCFAFMSMYLGELLMDGSSQRGVALHAWALKSALSIAALNEQLVGSWITLEQCMNAVERVGYYLSLLDSASSTLVEAPKRATTSSNVSTPPSLWPESGEVVLENLSIAYRDDLARVLRNVGCTIGGGERVGVVGRTGAGKSTITLALFRILEPAAGRVIIDGIDIATMGLIELRSKLAMVPQDPTLLYAFHFMIFISNNTTLPDLVLLDLVCSVIVFSGQ
jgi:ABC-type multidrug transport system fused ATPase/permease subunit